MSALGQKHILEGLRDVRFTPKSGHRSARWQCPLCATFGREQPQQNRSLFDHFVSAGEDLRERERERETLD
jgi:hypothetical protein